MDQKTFVRRALAAGAALMLLAAACTPAGTSETPFGTEPVLGTEPSLGTSAVATTVPTTEATAGDVSTQNVRPTGTEGAAAGTQAGTAVGTPEGTAVGTAAATQMSTEVGTAEGTAVGTQSPALTPNATSNVENMPAALLSSEILDSVVIDTAGAEVGSVEDLLIDNTGAVQYVIVDAEDYLGDRDLTATPAATPEANATETTIDEGLVAVPMANLTVNTTGTGDDDDHLLVYDGTADDLRGLGGFDKALLAEDSFVIDSTQSTVAANITYDGLIRASRLDDFDLRNADNDELGEVKDLIVNTQQHMVQYGVVDFGGFLGIGESTTAVPWSLLTVERATATDETNHMLLNVTKDQLENAPTIDLGDWPGWPERVPGNADWTPNWDNDITTFWQTAASQ